MESRLLLFVLLFCWGALTCPAAETLLPHVPTDPISGLVRIAEEFLSGSVSRNAYQSPTNVAQLDAPESLLWEGATLLQNKEFSVVPTDDYPQPSRSQSDSAAISTSFVRPPAWEERPRISSSPTDFLRRAPSPAMSAASRGSPTHHLRGNHLQQVDRALPPSADLTAPAAEPAPSNQPEVPHAFKESVEAVSVTSQVASPSQGPRRKHECSSCDSARDTLMTSGVPDLTQTISEHSVGRRLAAVIVGSSEGGKGRRGRLLADVLLPGPTDLHMSKVDPSPLSAEAELQDTPWWAGQPIQPVSKGPGDFKLAFQVPMGNITSLADLDDLTNDQLFDIFTNGLAEIPGGGKDDSGKFTLCVGRGITNIFTNTSWPMGVWPRGPQNPIQNVVNRIWRGKVFYNDPTANITRVWNLMWTNSTVAFTGNITLANPGISSDGGASAILDYGGSELPLVRPVTDEMRRVGPSIWLGRVWLTHTLQRLNPSSLSPDLAPFLQYLVEAETATVGWAATVTGLKDQYYQDKRRNSAYFTKQEDVYPFPAWFALDCRRNATPQLYYTAATKLNERLTTLTGYNDVLYTLPPLNKGPDGGAIENLKEEAPVSTAGRLSTPFILYPWKASDVGPLGYIKIPARFLEPIFGAWWMYNDQKHAANQTRDSSTALLQQYVEFPIKSAAQDFVSPVLDPLARDLGKIPNEQTSLFALQRPFNLDLPILAP